VEKCQVVMMQQAAGAFFLLLLLTASGYVPGCSDTTIHNTIQYTKNTK
jgi:hypothetical protein